MNKKEKYINFIVDDLIKKTEIDHDQETIKLPFLSYPQSPFLTQIFPYSPIDISRFTQRPPHSLHSFFKSFSTSFSNHVRKVYGAHSVEINIIWKLYKERIHSLIKK